MASFKLKRKYFSSGKLEDEIKRELLSRLNDELDIEKENFIEGRNRESRIAYQQLKDQNAKDLLERISQDKSRMRKINADTNRYQSALNKIKKFDRLNTDERNGILKFMQNHPELQGIVNIGNKRRPGVSEYNPHIDEITISRDSKGNYAIPAHENGHRLDHLSGEVGRRVTSFNNDLLDRMERSGANNENFLWNVLEEHDRVTKPGEQAATTNAYWDMFKNSKISNKQLDKGMKHLKNGYDSYEYNGVPLLNRDDVVLNKIEMTSPPFDYYTQGIIENKKDDVNNFKDILSKNEKFGGVHEEKYLNYVQERQLPQLKTHLINLLKEKGITPSQIKEIGGFDNLLNKLLTDHNFITDLKDRAKLMDELRNLKYKMGK